MKYNRTKFIPYGRQTIDASDVKAVSSVLKSDWLTQGPDVAKFEKALADYCGAKYAVAVSSGTAALHIAYLAAGLKKGDEVITTPNTFVATANMLLVVGAKPVFCDIRPDTRNIDEKKIEALVTGKTKAIVPVHFAGEPCEMAEIIRVAKKHKLIVIEDACHALGAEYKNRKIGAVGGMTVFSFHPVKSITTGEGGAVLTNDKNFYKKLISLRSHGVEKDKNGFNVMKEMGYNYRITDIQAALGISQLKKIGSFVNKRRRLAALYQKLLGGLPEIILPVSPSGRSARHLYVIETKNEKDRLPLYNFLKQNGIGVNFHYPPVYSHPYYRKIGIKADCPNADRYGKTAITLPLFPTLTDKEVKFTTGKVKEYFTANAKPKLKRKNQSHFLL